MSVGKLVPFLLAAASVPAAAQHKWKPLAQSDVETVLILWESVTPIGPSTRIAWFMVEPRKPAAYDYYLEQDVIDCARGTFTTIALIDYRKGKPPLKATIITAPEQKPVLRPPGTIGADMVKAVCDMGASKAAPS